MDHSVIFLFDSFIFDNINEGSKGGLCLAIDHEKWIFNESSDWSGNDVKIIFQIEFATFRCDVILTSGNCNKALQVPT